MISSRTAASAALLNYGFTFYDTKLVVKGGAALASTRKPRRTCRGTVSRSLARMAHDHGALILVDAAQALDRCLEVLADATNVIAEGEVLQLMNCHNTAIGEHDYLQVIRFKTAVAAATILVKD